MGFLAAAAPFIPSVIGGVGNIIGGLLGKSGAEKTNQKQIDMTYDLTKNKHKYAMEDLKQSGLNPLLSVTTPSSAGSAPKLDNPNKQLGESVSNAANSAMSLATQRAALDNLKEQNNLIKAQIGETHQRTVGHHINNTKNSALTPLYEAGGNIVEKVVNTGREAIENHSAKTAGTTVIPPPKPITSPQTVKGAQEVSSSWLQKNIKSFAQLQKSFDSSHWIFTKPKWGDPNYMQRMKAYNYVQFLKRSKTPDPRG